MHTERTLCNGSLIKVAISLSLVAAVGCNRGPAVPMTGTVTLDGQPVNHGTIALSPTTLAAAPATGGAVEEGRYDITAEKGPHRGVTYRVEISAVDRSNAKAIGEFVPDSIPKIYNSDSKLTVTIPDDAGSFEYDFKLTSKSSAKGR